MMRCITQLTYVVVGTSKGAVNMLQYLQYESKKLCGNVEVNGGYIKGT